MDVLLMGDSISAYMRGGFDIQDFYYRKNNQSTSGSDCLKLYRAGVENFTTNDIRGCVSRINYSDYDIVLLQCGINDFFMPFQDDEVKLQTPEEIANGIVDLSNLIRQKSNKPFILQSVYPVKVDGGWLNFLPTLVQDVCQINNTLQKYCQQNNIPFLDTHSLLSDKAGEMDDKYSDDGVHPNVEGYNLVYEGMVNVIKSLNLQATEEKQFLC